MLRGKIFTPSEADRMIPLVRRVVRGVRAARRLADRASAGTPDPAWRRRLEARIQSGREELEALGCALRCERRGRVECYGDVDGLIVYLVWTPGAVGFDTWRSLDGPEADALPLARCGTGRISG